MHMVYCGNLLREAEEKPNGHHMVLDAISILIN
jgi:hypothetical protein